MKLGRTFIIGGVGSLIVGICCFTSALVIALGAVGLSAWLAWLDYVLLPLFFGFIGLTVFGLWFMVRPHDRANRAGTSA